MICRFSTDTARRSFTPVDNRFLLDYLPGAEGTAVKVYLFGLMQCTQSGGMDCALCDGLGISENAARDAFVYWQEQGLVRIRSEKPLLVEYLDLDPSDAPAPVPGRYYGLVSALNALTAPRQMDMRELKHVYDWVEVYGLEEGTVIELVSHCMDLKGRRVSVNYMGAVAQSWAESGIVTREDAISLIERTNLSRHGATAILRQWNKQRKPTKDEMALYEKWTGEWGFTQEAVMAVLPRLSLSGTPNFVYLDEQLALLRERGHVDEESVRQEDQGAEEEKAFARLLFDRAGKQENATKTQRAQINLYLGDYHMPRELLLFGAEQCRGANEPFGLMKKLWNQWHEAGVDTIQKAEAFQHEQAPKPSRSGGRGKSAAYTQHDLSDAELDKLLINLDEELT